MKVFDNSRIWHIAAALVENTRNKLDNWEQALCGYYFRPDKRNREMQSCKKCLDKLTNAMAAKSTASRLVFRPKTLPRRISEQRFEPPEGLV